MAAHDVGMPSLLIGAPDQAVFLQRLGARRRLHRVARWILLGGGGLVLACLALGGGIYLFIHHDGNFHAVEPRLVYRSAQPSADELRQLVAAHGIKTVLNLRGDNTGKPWYDEEVSTVREIGIQHLNLRMSAYQVLSVQQMDEIVRLIQQAPKPLLIHCESGSDRTGLVAALYLLSNGQPATLASQELGARFGHLPVLKPRSAAMDQSLAAYLQSGRAPKLATR